MSDHTAEADAVASLAIAGHAPRTATSGDQSSRPFVVLQQGQMVHDIEKLFPTPSRKTGKIIVRDSVSFVRMVRAHQTEGTVLYGTMDPPKFVAVLNDHSQALPGWRDHVVEYVCPKSVEWATWTGSNKKVMAQKAFAQFIEDNAPDIIDSTMMIEVSRSLEAKRNVNFASATRLSNGDVQFTYEEETKGTAGKGQLEVPEVFTIAIPVLEGGPKHSIKARLRYDLDKGVLTMWYDLERPHKDLEAAVTDVWQAIEVQAGAQIINGG